ncbi:MAG: metallophosphatase family protein [Actinobacteria bacterium]|nr:metallophosphatase family protein [Actinomycetota bacterium]
MTAPRVAALYDVHGNLPALEATLADVRRVAPDALVVVGGDFAVGPFPRESVEALRSLEDRAAFIRGNGERELFEGRDTPADAWADRARFVARVISDEQRGFLRDLPETITIEVAGLGRVLFCHGTPRSDSEIVTRLTPESRLADVVAAVDAAVVVCGHTHVQFDRAVGTKRIVNAGSVGMPYEGDPGAYWALLGPDVDLRRTPYDTASAAAAIRATAFPQAEEFVQEFVLNSYTADEASEQFERAASG